jgi:ATP-dependent Zn protease
MSNNNDQFNQNDNNQPKMPKFNMNWLYIIIMLFIALMLFSGGGEALLSGSSPTQEATYTKFKEYVNKGYAKSVVINKDDGVLKMYVKPKYIRDVFHLTAQQAGPNPYVKVEFGSVDGLEGYLTAQQKAGKLTDFSYENNKGGLWS